MNHPAPRPRVSWQGVFPAVTVQYRDDADLTVDVEATAKVVENLVKDGVSGLIINGTVGENCSLTRHEKLAVLEAAVARGAPGAPACDMSKVRARGAKRVQHPPACRCARAPYAAGASGQRPLGVAAAAVGSRAPSEPPYYTAPATHPPHALRPPALSSPCPPPAAL